MSEARDDKGPSQFPTTHWSLVVQAGQGLGDAKRRALARLLQRYTPPLRMFLVCTMHLDGHRADDLLQAFVADKVLEQDLIQRAEEGRGRFRSFLVASLERFVLNQLRYEGAQKRSTRGQVSLDAAQSTATLGASPSDAFDVAWAREVLAGAVDRMRQACALRRPEVWGVFEARTLAPLFEDKVPIPYRELVTRFGFASPTQAANALVVANRMFVRVLREVVGAYEKSAKDIDEELADLRRILSSAG